MCFLVNYILSWDHNWKRGRLSETEVTETLCVQPPACLPYLLTLQETRASSLPRVIMGLAATSHSDLYIKICICLFECGKVVGTSNQCWAGTWFGGLESQGSVQVSENQIGIRYAFCNQNPGCGFSKTGTKPKLRYWLYKNQNWIVIQDFWKEGLELGVNCWFWSRLVGTRTGFCFFKEPNPNWNCSNLFFRTGTREVLINLKNYATQAATHPNCAGPCPCKLRRKAHFNWNSARMGEGLLFIGIHGPTAHEPNWVVGFRVENLNGT